MSSTVSFERFYNIVGNEKREATEETYYGIDPSNRRALWEAPVATQKDLDDAVTRANKAFQGWSSSQHGERSRFVKEFADELDKYKAEFARLLSKETGKPPSFAEQEVSMGIMTVRANAEWSVPDQVLKNDGDVKIVVQHAPLGVVGGIVPWNYPFQLAILKIAPSLMAGCTVIVKPSPFTPYTALKLGEIAAQAFPPGIVQVLGGNECLGPWMTKHPGIAKISFTGSTATGKKIMAAVADTLKRVNLKLGGNDAVIVTEDFDIVKAAQLAAQATFTHSGQMCHATKRIYVQDSVYDSFLHHFRSVVSSYELGEGFLSPIQNRMQYDKVRSIYTDCEVNNYEFVLGDAKIPEPLPGTGYFVAPAIIARPPETSRIAQEEPFGPTVPVFSFSSDEDVIARANNTETGLGATLYCRNKTRAWKIASALETGGVWVNGGLKMHPEALFGAHKQSGIGGELGPLGLKFYTNTRTVTFWKSATPDAATDLFA